MVYGVRSARTTDTFFKRFTAQSFYKLMQAMGVDIVYDHADYRLMSSVKPWGLVLYLSSWCVANSLLLPVPVPRVASD